MTLCCICVCVCLLDAGTNRSGWMRLRCISCAVVSTPPSLGTCSRMIPTSTQSLRRKSCGHGVLPSGWISMLVMLPLQCAKNRRWDLQVHSLWTCITLSASEQLNNWFSVCLSLFLCLSLVLSLSLSLTHNTRAHTNTNTCSRTVDGKHDNHHHQHRRSHGQTATGNQRTSFQDSDHDGGEARKVRAQLSRQTLQDCIRSPRQSRTNSRCFTWRSRDRRHEHGWWDMYCVSFCHGSEEVPLYVFDNSHLCVCCMHPQQVHLHTR